MSGHKTGNTAKGAVGCQGWKIGGTGKVLAVMYSIPYDHNLHSNWCGVGIFDDGESFSFKKMYYESQVHFSRSVICTLQLY